jgi:hypothetical protein
MNNKNWLVFSFSVPAKHQAFRVKIWRKLNALGAVQVKNALYLLPAGERHQEQLTWLAKETEDQGGEAVILAGGELLHIPDAQIRTMFARARDEDFKRLEEELRAALATPESGDIQASLRKFGRRLEAIRAIDFFPSGRGEALSRLLEEAGRHPQETPPAIPRRDPASVRGKTWMTRTNPYVDRLSSFWLVRRHLDPEARIAFLPPGEAAPQQADTVLFDMAEADFTHTGGRITFEVIAEAFGLTDAIPLPMRRVLRAIDLEDFETAPEEARGVKRMLDGLVAACPDDRQRMELALAFFDTLLASYTATHK